MKNFTHYFQYADRVNPALDPIIQAIEDVRNRNYAIPRSGLRFLAYEESTNMGRGEIGKWMTDHKNDSWGVLAGEWQSMLTELKRATDELEEFYLTKWNYTRYSKEGLSPQQILYCQLQLKLRLDRIVSTIEPHMTKTSAKHPKTGILYWMIKAYEIDDAGERKRTFSRNVIRGDAAKNDMATKLFDAFDVTVIATDVNLQSKFMADMIIEHKNKRWLVETKDIEQDDFFRFYTILGLWKQYKIHYQIK